MSAFQRKFSITLSVIIAVVASILFFIISISGEPGFSWKDLCIFLVAIFLLTYALVVFSSKIFIFERLAQILDSIIQYRNNKDQRKKYQPGEDVISDIRDEVKGWADDKKNEADRLKKLELYRKEYIGNVSHELKTPIFNIQGYILTLLDGGLEDPKVNREYLVRAEKSVERMINIIEDLESISQLETGELMLEPDRFDVIALTKDICEGQEMKAAAKGIIFSIKKEVTTQHPFHKITFEQTMIC